MTQLFVQIFNTDITTEDQVSKNDFKYGLRRLVKVFEHFLPQFGHTSTQFSKTTLKMVYDA